MAMRYIYGPVASWRLGRSLGVDLISADEKVCSFDCGYCQIGPTKRLTDRRRVFVATDDVLAEIRSLPTDVKIDYITFSGMGEPTLAANLGEVIRRIKEIRTEPVCVLTNSSLISDHDVRIALAAADRVIAKLDAATQSMFERLNRPVPGLKLTDIIKGLCIFKNMYRGQLDLQMMFVEDNESEAPAMADLARLVRPDEVEINTPLRPPIDNPLPPERLKYIETYFAGIATRNVYDVKRGEAQPLDRRATDRRRPVRT